MSRARDNADLGDSYGALAVGVTGGSGLNAVNAANIAAGVLPVGVTGGSGLTALGTVTAGNLSHADIVYPAGHVLQVIISPSVLSVSTGTVDHVVHDGGNLAITPSSTSSKIFIMVTGNVGVTIVGNPTLARVYPRIYTGTFNDDSTDSSWIGENPLIGHQNYAYSNSNDAYLYWTLHLSALHSPSTESAVSYGFGIKRTTTSDAGSSANARITLFEVAG